MSLSTAEGEWYAASEACKELLYLRIIMREFGFPQLGPMYLYEDSRVVVTGGFSFFLLRKHFITEKIYKKKSGEVNYEAKFSLFFCFIRGLNLYSRVGCGGMGGWVGGWRDGWMGGFVKVDNRFGYEKWTQWGCIGF